MASNPRVIGTRCGVNVTDDVSAGHPSEPLLDLGRVAVRRDLVRRDDSLTVQKCVARATRFCPAPETPDFASITTCSAAQMPDSSAGAAASSEAVG